MDREQMIAELKAAGIRAVATVATFDMGLQYDFITPNGAGTGFGNMGRWPLYKFKRIGIRKWRQICDAIKNETLTVEMLTGTGLDQLFESIYTVHELQLSEVFENLKDIDGTKKFYCLFDAGMLYYKQPDFYESENDVKRAFEIEYCSNESSWDSMDDDELSEWHKRLKSDLRKMWFAVLDED